MNYFEFYCGDYARDTAHLSLAEHGAFLMLLSAYYSTERPLPADLPALHRIARAMTKPEQQAVNAVAEQFFPVGEDGLRHNERADEEVTKAQGRIDAARANGRKGGRPPNKKPKENPAGFDSVRSEEPSGKALHTPHATTPSDTTARTAGSEVPRGTDAGRACKAMGMAGMNPSHPHLLAALDEGVSIQALADTATEAKSKGKGFAWAISTARGRHAEGAAPINGGANATARKLSPGEQARASIAARKANETRALNAPD